MPTYAALIYEKAGGAEPTPEEWNTVMAEYNEFGQKAANVIVGGEALEGVQTATTVHVEGGKDGELQTTDGPFAETKEILSGFYLLKCENLDEAVQWAAQIPGAWHGKVEVRPCIDFTQAG
jgi:hypothetical protein